MRLYGYSALRVPGYVVTDRDNIWNSAGKITEKGKFTGSAFDFFYTHNTQHVYIYGHYQNVGANFRAYVGFFDQADNILLDGGGEYRWRRNPGHWFTRISLGSGYIHEIDHDKNLLRKGFHGWLYYRGPFQSGVNLDVNTSKRTFMGKEFTDNTLYFSGWVRPSGSLYLWLSGAFGDRVDFTNAQDGTRVRLNHGVRYNLGRHLDIELGHTYEKLNVEDGRLYTANISNIQLVYQFSRRAFLRTILQYVNYL